METDSDGNSALIATMSTQSAQKTENGNKTRTTLILKIRLFQCVNQILNDQFDVLYTCTIVQNLRSLGKVKAATAVTSFVH